MIAEIIAIGTEITTGSTLNTNSKYLSSKLSELGIETHYHTSVDDDPKRLENIIKIALNRVDLIITTGGLGPTQDDMTKEVISKALGIILEKNYKMEKDINNMFLKMNKVMTDNNIKQAAKPRGSKFIKNHIGTAPGIFMKIKDKTIIMLPGPPWEMSLMFEKEVSPLLKNDSFIIKKSINLIGIGESDLESRLMSLKTNKKNISLATFADQGSIEIKIIGKGKVEEKANIEVEVNQIINKIKANFNDYIYSYDNASIEKTVVDLLKLKNYKLGLAESCTGGLIASKITSIPGVSSVFERGIVSYSNSAKTELLNVNKHTLDKYGAVSREVAYEMARGLLNKTHSLDIVLSITGIAGPAGASSDKPIGLVYMCIMTKSNHRILKFNFNGNRILIQNRAAVNALNEVRKTLLRESID